jgi:hypothetical protein
VLLRAVRTPLVGAPPPSPETAASAPGTVP